MTPPVVTLLFTGLLALMLLALATPIVLRRRAMRVGIGSGGDEVLARRIRVQANFVEYVPVALLLLGLLETCGLPRAWVAGFGIALLLGRVLHAMGLSQRAGYSFGRFYGTLLTWLVLLGMALAAMAIAIRALL